MGTKTIPEIQNEVSSILTNYQWMFERNEWTKLRTKTRPELSNTDSHTRRAVFNWPKIVSRNAVDGLKLINEKGYIAIRQSYLYKNNTRDLDLVGYVYKYMTDEMIYKSLHRHTNKDKDLHYIFHYDMDLLHAIDGNSRIPINEHSNEHLQVMHELPRFRTTDISLPLFFSHVIQLCFKKTTATDYEPRKEPFFNFSK